MDDYNMLLFRRQFLLGYDSYKTIEGWKTFSIGREAILSVHPDLDVTISSNSRIILLGFILDPFDINADDSVIIEKLSQYEDFNTILSLTNNLGGRWVIIFINSETFKIFNDACGLRQVYYLNYKGKTWCASQPELITHVLKIDGINDSSVSLNNFIKTYQYTKNLHFWPGDTTPNCDIFHLIPNHYLDLLTSKVQRFWPNISFPREEKNTCDAVKKCAAIIKGTIESAEKRYKLILPVTSGYDSRTALAACHDIKDKIMYYIYQHHNMPDSHSDIRIPVKLFKRIGEEFSIFHDRDIDYESLFYKVYFKNVTLARNNYFVNMNYDKYNRLSQYKNIDTFGSEIGKGKFRYCKGNLSGKVLASAVGYDGIDYVIQQYDKWISNSIEIIKKCAYNPLDIFYWEQDVANVCALAYAENDIAVEDFSVFDNRNFIVNMLSVPEQDRIYPHKFHQALIKYLWPELLKEPFNPESFIKKIRNMTVKSLRHIGFLPHIKRLIHLRRR